MESGIEWVTGFSLLLFGLSFTLAPGYLGPPRLWAQNSSELVNAARAGNAAKIYQRMEILERLGAGRSAEDPTSNDDSSSNNAARTKGAGVVTPPSLKKQVQPKYTDDALHRRREGEVVLGVVITKEGQVGDVRVKTSIDVGLDLNAIACVREWRFTPGMVDRAPVDVVAEIAVEFKIL